MQDVCVRGPHPALTAFSLNVDPTSTEGVVGSVASQVRLCNRCTWWLTGSDLFIFKARVTCKWYANNTKVFTFTVGWKGNVGVLIKLNTRWNHNDDIIRSVDLCCFYSFQGRIFELYSQEYSEGFQTLLDDSNHFMLYIHLYAAAQHMNECLIQFTCYNIMSHQSHLSLWFQISWWQIDYWQVLKYKNTKASMQRPRTCIHHNLKAPCKCTQIYKAPTLQFTQANLCRHILLQSALCG